jgi:SAM-dependent methyltransferase
MKRKFYYFIYNFFVKVRVSFVPASIMYYLESLTYFSRFSIWLRKYNPPILDNKRDSGPERRYQLHKAVFEKEGLSSPILYLEFGVASGTSLKWWVDLNKNSSSRFYGFDTFEGLPEAWFANKKGDFTAHGNFPDIHDARVQFIKGLYQDTLLDFMNATDLGGRKVIHIDADLYSSTLFVLTSLHRVLKKGDILIFDDFAYLMGEFRALEHYTASYYTLYEVIGSSNHFGRVAIKIS